jgi:hypothetical protein
MTGHPPGGEARFVAKGSHGHEGAPGNTRRSEPPVNPARFTYMSKRNQVVSQMESQHADANEELLLELKSKNTTRSIKDFSPEGIRLESNLEGDAKGVYNATFYATITMLVKPDRTIDYEVRQIHTTSDGDTVLVYYKGSSIIESPTHNKFVGETTFQTSSKKLAWLNGMKARHEGEYNPVAGENDFQVYGKR